MIGHCSGGRQAFLAACSLQLDAAVDCYGAFVVNEPPPECRPSMKPILGLAPQLSCPLLGLFGAEDQLPRPRTRSPCWRPSWTEARQGARVPHLRRRRATRSSPSTGPSYRPEAAVDGWQKIFDFFGRTLSA